jgi:hypothetical protein
MHIEEFTQDEQKALRECVAALKVLPIYVSPEFELIFGNSKDEVEEVYNSFPNWDLYDEEAEGYDPSGDVLRNTLTWLLDGKDEMKKIMYSRLSFPLTQLPELYEKLMK